MRHSTGLIRAVEALTLGDWLTRYIKLRQPHIKPASLKKLESTQTKLIEAISADTPLHRISTTDADNWWRSMKESGLSEASMKTHAGNAKTIIKAAIKRELLIRNPFEDLKSGNTPTNNNRYVTPKEIEKVLANCPNSAWRVVVGLARFAGLRMPSEAHALTWGDIDWEASKLYITSSKTEAHRGKGARYIPIDARLYPILQEAFELAAEGQTHIVTLQSERHLRKHLQTIIKNAKVEKWPGIFQTLRRSRETEWMEQYPRFIVAKWMGHSEQVSARHYTTDIPEEYYKTASGAQGGAPSGAAHGDKPLQANEATTAQPHTGKEENDEFAMVGDGLPEDANPRLNAKNGAGGNRTPVS